MAVHVYYLWLLLFLFILFKFNFNVVLFDAIFFILASVHQLRIVFNLVEALVTGYQAHRFKVFLLARVLGLRSAQQLVWLLGNLFFLLLVTYYFFVLLNSFLFL